MRCIFFFAILAVILLCPLSARAALPYYNSDMGYTIWLPRGWTEVSDADLSRFENYRDGIGADMTEWVAGYIVGGDAKVELLVSELHGRVVSKESIGNFNRFVVRQLKRASQRSGCEDCARLRKANFDKQKNVLRLEMDVTNDRGKSMTSVVYIIYTSTGMLKFTGRVNHGDRVAVKVLDKAVSTLYLDYGLRQE